MQDDALHGKLDGGAEDHRGNAARLRRQVEGCDAPKSIPTGPKAVILIGLMLIRLPVSVVMMLCVGSWVLGGCWVKPSVRVACDKGEHKQRHERSDAHQPHVAAHDFLLPKPQPG